MSLIGMGRQNLRLATAGFAKSAELEAKENALRSQIEAAKDAQAMQTYGAGASIGGLYGMKALGDSSISSAASPTLSQALSVQQSGVNAATSGLPQMSVASGAPQVGSAAQLQGMGTATADALGVSTVAPQMSNAAGVADTAAKLTKAGGDAVAASGATTGSAAAASSTPVLSSIATVAAPIAIGLGVAYLINKLFD